jgi:hypothetical protein
MQYILRGGTLYEQGKKLACLRYALCSTEKRIFLADGTLALRADIHRCRVPHPGDRDLYFKRYVIADAAGTECAVCKPRYAPELTGRRLAPMSQMTAVDHAEVLLLQQKYSLLRRSATQYTLLDLAEEVAVELRRKGVQGGWSIETAQPFAPELLCGLFAFCRYLERENELVVV